MMKQRKLNVALLFGGKSAEHEVSLRSAKNVVEAMDRDRFNPILIGIDKAGNWLLNEHSSMLVESDDGRQISLNSNSDAVALVPQSNGHIFNFNNPGFDRKIDVAFPILHGPFGEDGTVQGLLKLANVPFVGTGVLGAAVGMDKDIMKRLLRDAGLPIGEFISLSIEQDVPSFQEIKEKLGLPCFVKPANLGSSVGISRAETEEEYQKAVAEAFEFDNKIVVEEFIEGREMECAILGNQEPRASVVGEISFDDSFYSYDAKYVDEGGYRIDIPAAVSADLQGEIQEIAIKTFKVLACEGFARVDVFLTPNHKIVVNEINTIPGFTKISMYPKLWEASGIAYSDLISKLIDLAIERFEKEQRIRTSIQ